MKSLYVLLIILTFVATDANSQVSNGRVSSLIAAENYFAASVNEHGIRDGFLKVSDNQTLVFRPSAVKAETFYAKKGIDPGVLSWEPSYARISRSGDWGFTTGPYSYTATDDGQTSYGQYFSLWRANKRGVWKLALEIGSPHPKPQAVTSLNYTDAKDSRFFRQISPVRLKQREDMIMASDKLFASTLTKSANLGYNTFLGDEARLIFPGFEPIVGKNNITNFIQSQGINIYSEPILANRSIGSDLAYTYGTAQVTRNDKTLKYNYVRVWESQEGSQWNVIVELFSPAED